MPVPFPTDAEADRSRPTKDEAWLNARAFASAAAPAEGLTRLQAFALRGLTQALTADLLELGDLSLLEPITPEAYAEGNARRDKSYRIRRVQTMVLLELLLRPLPDDVACRVEAFADALGVGDDCREVVAATRHLAAGATDMALADFMRNGYEVLHLERAGEEPPEDVSSYWAPAHDDPGLAARWDAMQDGSPTSLGRRVWEFYKGRGFNFPGTPNSVPPRLAQHDFVHVLADYGTTVESEIEVFALIARADEDPRSFSLLVAVLALFEGGYLEQGLGAFRADPGHLSHDSSGMGTRLGNAIARGGEVAWRFHENRTASTSWPSTGTPGPMRSSTTCAASSASTDPGPSPWRPKQPVRPARSNPAASPSPSSSGAGTWPGPRDGPTTPSGRRCRPVRPIRPTAQIDAGPVPSRRLRGDTGSLGCGGAGSDRDVRQRLRWPDRRPGDDRPPARRGPGLRRRHRALSLRAAVPGRSARASPRRSPSTWWPSTT